MLLLRTLPYVADTPANRDFRRYFYSKWGKENCIISARERRAEYPMFTQCLSVKAAWGGSERYFLDGRTVAVDDDNYLIVNDRRTSPARSSAISRFTQSTFSFVPVSRKKRLAHC
jgi:hypothetical protein